MSVKIINWRRYKIVKLIYNYYELRIGVSGGFEVLKVFLFNVDFLN